MLNKNVQKWIEALRSGEYPQTVGFLHDAKGYCCLGVACEIYIKEGLPLPTGRIEYFSSTFYYGDENETESLPPEVQNWLGLSSISGQFYNSKTGQVDELVNWNDDLKSFNEIADLIESMPEDLFVEE